MRDSLRTLYICYLTLEDPLVHTQVVAYLQGLAERGHTIHLLTFEPDVSPERHRELAAQMLERGIAWHGLRYHKRPSLPATAYDVVRGAAVAVRLVRRHRLEAIHARNHVPAAMALLAQLVVSCRLIFDLRGLMADEYADAGIWRRGGLPYRITNWVQRVSMRRAQGIVVLTEAVRRYLEDRLAPGAKPHVIPCCVDLSRLDGAATERPAARARLGIEERPVMVYVGKFTGWYMEREMVEFCQTARAVLPGLLFLVVTQADPAPLRTELSRCGIPASDYLITSAAPDEVGLHLAAADFGISFVRPCFSKISSSPTKVPEYMAAGLPTVSTAIGDMSELLGDGRAGVLVERFESDAYEVAARTVQTLVQDPNTRDHCRRLARDGFSLQGVGVPRYDRVYRQVARL